MKNRLKVINQNAKLALSKSKSLLNITNGLLSKKTTDNLEKEFGYKPFLIERGHLGFISNVVMTNDEKYLVSESGDDIFGSNDIKIWDIKSGECLRTIKGYEEKIDILKVTSDRKYIVALSIYNNKVLVWNFNSGELLYKINVSTNLIDISPDSKYIVTSDASKEIKIWNIKNGEYIRTLKGHHKTISSVLISSSGKHIVSTDISGLIKIWSANDTTCLRTIKVHDEDITSTVISKDESKILVVCNNHIIKIWDFESGKFLKRIDRIGSKNLMSITTDLTKVITINSSNMIEIWDLDSCEIIKKIDRVDSKKNEIILTPNIEKVIVIKKMNIIEIWDLENCKCSNILSCGQTDYITSATISFNGQIVAIENSGTTCVVWDIKSNECVYIFEEYEVMLEISEDGKTITMLDLDDMVHIYNIRNGECLDTISRYEYLEEEQKENSTISCVHNNYEVRLINTQNSECILTIIPDYEIVIDKNGYFIVDTENCIDDYIRISEDSFNQRKLTKDEKDNFCKIKNKKVSPIQPIEIDEDEIPF